MSSARIVSTPAGHFRLSYADQSTSSRDSATVTARRFGRMPENLAAITDVAADPCFSDGERFRDNARPDVTVNGVTYTGTLYYVSRGYFIGANYVGDNGWSISYPDGPEYGHYWTGQHLTRYTDSRGFQAISDAGLRKLSGWLEQDTHAMLADSDGLRDYWRSRFQSEAGYAIANARRDLEAANGFLTWARTYGADTPLVDVDALIGTGVR